MGRPKGSGKSFVEWCNESGRRGARLLLECREKDPSKFTKGSELQGAVEVRGGEVPAQVACDGEQPHDERQTHRMSEVRESNAAQQDQQLPHVVQRQR